MKYCSDFSRVSSTSLWKKKPAGQFPNVGFGYNEGFIFFSETEAKVYIITCVASVKYISKAVFNSLG